MKAQAFVRDEAFQKEVVRFLKEKRLAAKISQVQIAHALGYRSSQFVSMWERGTVLPPLQTICELSHAYGFDRQEAYEIYERNLHRILRYRLC